MSSERLLLESLKQGLYIQNLHHMAALCRNLALDTAHPVPFFVMRHIFLDIARQWEVRPSPLEVEEAQALESKIMKPLEELLTEIASGATNQQIDSLLRTLVATYLSITA